MTTHRDAALSALQTAWNLAGETPEGKNHPGEMARTKALAGIGFALLDIAAAIRHDTGPLSAVDFQHVETVLR